MAGDVFYNSFALIQQKIQLAINAKIGGIVFLVIVLIITINIIIITVTNFVIIFFT